MKLTAAILIVLGVFVGCRKGSEPDPAELAAIEEYGMLPGLKSSANVELRDELARIVEEKGTPELLMGPEIPDEENVAAGLRDLFPIMKVRAILDESAELFPPRRFEFNALRRKKATKFLAKYEDQQRQAREALGRPRCDFAIRHVAGCAADGTFIDVVRICARLEAFAAAEALAQGEPAEAIEAFGRMLRLAECLGAEKQVDARLQAAMVRGEAWRVLQAIVRRGAPTAKHLQQLDRLVRAHLKTWPRDADAWIGDRALGMFVYELAREGKIRLLLTPEEKAEFAEEDILEDLPAAAKETADQDELFYLQAMRKVIDRCKQPYHARATLGEEIQNDLDRRRDTADYPVVADRMLLRDIAVGLLRQAQDRAVCDAWALALAEAVGRDAPGRINPVTGAEYHVEKQKNRIAVWLVDPGRKHDEPDMVVPRIRD
jgi:hypothetical protein